MIIVFLFAFQRRGTAAVGRLFGPGMIAWFVAIGACGVVGIVAPPEICECRCGAPGWRTTRLGAGDPT